MPPTSGVDDVATALGRQTLSPFRKVVQQQIPDSLPISLREAQQRADRVRVGRPAGLDLVAQAFLVHPRNARRAAHKPDARRLLTSSR